MFDDSKPEEYLYRDIIVEAIQMKEDLIFETNELCKIASAGDWIVKHKNGIKKIVDPKKFFNDYTKIRSDKEMFKESEGCE